MGRTPKPKGTLVRARPCLVLNSFKLLLISENQLFVGGRQAVRPVVGEEHFCIFELCKASRVFFSLPSSVRGCLFGVVHHTKEWPISHFIQLVATQERPHFGLDCDDRRVGLSYDSDFLYQQRKPYFVPLVAVYIR